MKDAGGWWMMNNGLEKFWKVDDGWGRLNNAWSFHSPSPTSVSHCQDLIEVFPGKPTYDNQQFVRLDGAATAPPSPAPPAPEVPTLPPPEMAPSPALTTPLPSTKGEVHPAVTNFRTKHYLTQSEIEAYCLVPSDLWCVSVLAQPGCEFIILDALALK